MHFRKLLCLSFFPLFLMAQPKVQWRNALKNGVQSINSAVASRIDQSGNVFVLGNTHIADSTGKILLVKLDTAGTESWRRVYEAPGRYDAFSVALNIDLSGNLFITGTIKNASGNTDIVTLKYSNDGILLWEKIYGGKNNLFDAPAAITSDKKGNVLVCGYETAGEANPDLLLIRYSSAGEISFVRNFSTPQMDVAVDVMADDSCNAYVCGNTNVDSRSADITVLKYDSAGTLLWNYKYDGEQHVVDVATDFTFDDSTNIYITGTANHSNDKSDIPLIKISRNGRQISDHLISSGISDGMGSKITCSGKNIFLQTTFTDYLQQTVTSDIFEGDKMCNQKNILRSAGDVTYLSAAAWNDDAILLFGSMLMRPENTIAPYMELVDSLHHTVFTLHDDVLISLLRIKDVFLAGADVYFLGDDATENAGTISIVKYSLPEKPKTKRMVTKKSTK